MKSISRIIAEGRGNYITPRSVQDAIPIRRIYDDGMILTGNYFTKTLRFSDINYSSASENDRERLFIAQAQLINSLPDLEYTKLTIFNRPVGRTDQAKKTEIPDRTDGLKEYRDELQAYVSSNVTTDTVVQDKYLTIGINEKDPETARAYLAKETAAIRTGLDALGSEMEEVGIRDRLRIFHDFYNPYSVSTYSFDYDDTLKRGHSFKDYIAPDSFSFRSSYFMMGELYGRVLVMRTYGSSVRDEMVSFLTQRSRIMMLSADFYPIPTAQARQLVDRKLLGAETSKTKWQKRQNENSNFSAEPPFELQQQIDELREMLDDLMNRDQKMIMTTLTIVHLAKSREELDADTEELQNAANRFSCNLGTLMYQQYEGLNTVLPFGGKIGIYAQRTFTTECACCVTMPFSAKILQ
ncbi:MAG: TraE family protein, partial [Eubacteriaceae bacterium]|nr:TraE family protein [Eubacteriaceae bacterium]